MTTPHDRREETAYMEGREALAAEVLEFIRDTDYEADAHNIAHFIEDALGWHPDPLEEDA